jgi:UDP-N-acetylmuramate dehydrogenase
MYILKHNHSLREHNTFGLGAQAKYFLTVETTDDLLEFFRKDSVAKDEKKLIIGSGSNLLFINNFDGLVIHPEINGIQVINEDEDSVEVEVGAGVEWDYFVSYCVTNGWGGVENLSLIPGTVGAAPVQNIGAYGVEVQSVVYFVKGMDLQSLEYKSFNTQECSFGYRTSVFKAQFKENFIVTSVVFRLFKQPVFKLQYGELAAKVDIIGPINLQNIREAVISIRKSKLPDPLIVGNAGSFFKNPIVPELAASKLKSEFSEMPIYLFEPGKVKVAAGWLIEKAGWKGKSVGNCAVHDQQALVLVNKGGATGHEIFELSERIMEDVFEKFDIQLEREVQVVGS